LFTGPPQYPFLCFTSESGLGQPLVDNWEGRGNAVYAIEGDSQSAVMGYSENCSIGTRVDYFYLAADDRFYRYDADNPPSDIVQTAVDGEMLDFIVRVETGTLNRFIYNIAMLAPFNEDTTDPNSLDNSAWNNKLVYWLRGGVGIGHWQGRAAWHGGLGGKERTSFSQLLAAGYAIATSSGNATGVHYNLRLAEETAFMVKEHFVHTYGEPDYTISIGASGGAVQQYIIDQNRPGIFDAGIPMYSYPDMVTQAIYVGDCNLLEQYFLEELTLDGDSFWATWSNRKLIEGLNTSDTVQNSVLGGMGSSECIEGWFFAEPGVLNPTFTDPDMIEGLIFYGYSPQVIAEIHWTHWDDLRNYYGVNADGFAPIPFDNVGVQYGLADLVDGSIDKAEFLRINHCVGSWKEQADYKAFVPSEGNPFDSDNMNRDPAACRTGTPSPRRAGNLWAMQAAYLSGHVFLGHLSMPVIDLRPYLEPQLDMHNVRQSFSARKRLLNGQGDSDNQVIWFTGSEDNIPAQIMAALGVLDAYLTTGVPPAGFVDACYDSLGLEIASGTGVWDGILDAKPVGACTSAYPIFSSSRMVAGDDIAGDMFKCALKPVAQALTDGTYGTVSFADSEIDQLNAIFPQGVCDYSQPDAGRPPDL
jgi:hypothetical protein